MNCRGLGNSQKRKDVLNYLNGKHANICCLQDTHFVPEIEYAVKLEWSGNCLFANKHSNARGVAVLFDKNCQCEVKKQICDKKGNYVALSLCIGRFEFSLIALYAPNDDCPSFFEEIENIILDLNDPLVILCGDWNLLQDLELDSCNYVRLNNKNAQHKVLEMKNSFDLIDPWRSTYPDLKQYTWRQTNPLKQGRLDYFLISNQLYSLVSDCQIHNSYRSDHAMISLDLLLDSGQKRYRFWRFNNSFLKDDEYVLTVKDKIKEITLSYIDKNVHGNARYEDIEKIKCRFIIDDQIFFEILLMELRACTIVYGDIKKKEMDKTEKQLEDKIKQLELNLHLDVNKDSTIERIRSLKEELETIRSEKLKRKEENNTLQELQYGEKPSKYFFNLMKKRNAEKRIIKLLDRNNRMLNTEEEIRKEVGTFYEELYGFQEVLPFQDILHDLKDIDYNRVSNDKVKELDGKISLAEIQKVVNSLKLGKSPGQDGFTAEFFKFFLNDIGIYLMRSLNSSYACGKFSHFQNFGIVTLLPKGNKPRYLIKNWRPISLLNVQYKILSNCIANRIKPLLEENIHNDQKGFLPGRYIGENIRIIYDIISYTDYKNIPGILLFIDFEKAFDCVSHDFLWNVLQFFNYGDTIIKWVKLLYADSTSSVLINGCLTSRFDIKRGCRQGDPLSPYLFLLCAEILGMLVRKSQKIKGIVIENKEYRILQYADDTVLFLDSTESLHYALELLDFFF